MTMTMDYHIHHHRRCRCVTSVNISDDPSFDPSPFLIICPINVPSFDPIHGLSNYPSLSRGSSLHPNYLNVVHEISLDELDVCEILTTRPIPIISALTIDPDNTIDLLNIDSNESSQPRHCPDNFPSTTLDIDFKSTKF